jgi:hypothetical protein
MKAYNPKDWFKLIFNFHKSDSFRLLPTDELAATIKRNLMDITG